LKQAGLIAERPEGWNVFYRAEPKGLAPLFDWMIHYGVVWRDRLLTGRITFVESD